MANYQDQESSPNIIMNMLKIFILDFYAWLDLGATLSFTTLVYPWSLESILSVFLSLLVFLPMLVSLSQKVYEDCSISIYYKDTLVDLVKLDMVKFDAILGIHWLHACYTSINCRTRVVKFQLSYKSVFEWRGSSAMPRGRLISYLKVRKLYPSGIFVT